MTRPSDLVRRSPKCLVPRLRAMDLSGIASVAAVLADESRAGMCAALLDGRAWTVTELARRCGIAMSTASEHVTKLQAAGLVERVRQGRHVYVRLADAGVAELIEGLSARSTLVKPRTLSTSNRLARLSRARTCYDHLAGALGVGIRDGMLRLGLIQLGGGPALTEVGRVTLIELGVDLTAPARGVALRECLDWTERREHLAGGVPRAMLRTATAQGWLTRRPDRSVVVNHAAAEPLARLGVDCALVAPAQLGLAL